MSTRRYEIIRDLEPTPEEEAILDRMEEEYQKEERRWAQSGVKVQDLWEEGITFRAGGRTRAMLNSDKGQDMRQKAHKALDDWMNQFMN